ncbi:MAG: F0F1 ATP synthase subunit gamma [Anaerolineales bacterium]|nr:F0F1 ATP synthase subunit gamma [Anaerolineales bacterium]
MTQTLESLRGKINSATDLLSVVTTMKAISAVNIRHSEKAVEALAEYNRTIEMGLKILLMNSETTLTGESTLKNNQFGAIIFGSDQGLVGQFNRVIVNHALNEMNRFKIAEQDRILLVVGIRSAAILEQGEQRIRSILPVPSSIPHITQMLQEIIVLIESLRQEHGLDRLVLFYNHPQSGVSYRPVSLQLLPINIRWLQNIDEKEWKSRCLPTFTTDPNRLFSALIREHFLVSMFSAYARSMASENASRLATMQVAERNIEERIEELTHHYHQTRQTAITTEILDIVAGFEALTG